MKNVEVKEWKKLKNSNIDKQVSSFIFFFHFDFSYFYSVFPFWLVLYTNVKFLQEGANTVVQGGGCTLKSAFDGYLALVYVEKYLEKSSRNTKNKFQR